MFCAPKASEKGDDNATNLKSITIVLNQDMFETVAPYEFNIMETLLKMQILFDQFLTQQDSKKNWWKHAKLEDAVLVKIRAIPDGTTDTKELAKFRKLTTL